MIAVTFALPNESSDFVRLLRKSDYAERIEVCHTGVGKRAAQTRVADFLKAHSPRLLISAGFAGAVSNELNIGDIFFAENFSDAALLASIRQFGVVGRLETVAAIADDPKERADFVRRGVAAVDMETDVIANACAQRQIPMLSLRAISDTPAAPLGIPAEVLFDLERQRTNFVKLFEHVVTHPRQFAQLMKIARQTTTARRALATALDQVLRRLDVH